LAATFQAQGSFDMQGGRMLSIANHSIPAKQVATETKMISELSSGYLCSRISDPGN
jgi:hypothetical protein